MPSAVQAPTSKAALEDHLGSPRARPGRQVKLELPRDLLGLIQAQSLGLKIWAFSREFGSRWNLIGCSVACALLVVTACFTCKVGVARARMASSTEALWACFLEQRVKLMSLANNSDIDLSDDEINAMARAQALA